MSFGAFLSNLLAVRGLFTWPGPGALTTEHIHSRITPVRTQPHTSAVTKHIFYSLTAGREYCCYKYLCVKYVNTLMYTTHRLTQRTIVSSVPLTLGTKSTAQWRPLLLFSLCAHTHTHKYSYTLYPPPSYGCSVLYSMVGKNRFNVKDMAQTNSN